MIFKIINKKNIKKYLLVFILGIFIFSGVFAAQTNAEEGNVESPNSVDTVAGTKTQIGQAKELGGLGGVVVWIGSKILVFAAAGVDFSIALGDRLVGIKAVQIGWNIVLQFTNLGFVLAIIIIAFATILRIESYGTEKILLKLVVAALLVNFSLVIAGAFISMSATLSNVFITQALGDGGNNLSIALGKAIQPQKLGQVQERDAGWWDKLTNAFNYFFEYLAGLFFVIVFTFLAALAFLTLFIMLLIRIIALMILLIVAPIVWLLWIFPSTQKHWKKWWTEFLRWNFFAPTVLFFVYLAVATAAAFQSGDATLQDPAFQAALTRSQGQYSAAAQVNKTILNPTLDSVSSSQNEEGFFGYSAQLLVVLGMLYGGIYVANKFSIYGGNLGVDIAQSTGKNVGHWAGRLPLRAGSAAMRPRRWGERAGGRIRDTGESLSEKAKNMKWYNPAKYAVGWSGKRLTNVGKGIEKAPKYKPPKEYATFWGSAWGGMKSGSGLFKKRGEKKEKTQSQLNSLYTKKTALQQERDYLERMATRTNDEIKRLSELKDQIIPDVDKKIKDAEDSMGGGTSEYRKGSELKEKKEFKKEEPKEKPILYDQFGRPIKY